MCGDWGEFEPPRAQLWSLLAQVVAADLVPDFSEVRSLRALPFDDRFADAYARLAHYCHAVYADRDEALFWTEYARRAREA